MGIQFKTIDAPNPQEFPLPEYSFAGFPQTSLASRKVRWKIFVRLSMMIIF